MYVCVCQNSFFCLPQSTVSLVQQGLIYAPALAHAKIASFLGANPVELPHTSFSCRQLHPRHDLSGPQAADDGALARVRATDRLID